MLPDPLFDASQQLINKQRQFPARLALSLGAHWHFLSTVTKGARHFSMLRVLQYQCLGFLP